MSGPVKYHVGAFPPKKLEWEALIPLIGPANAAVARYDGLLKAIPNVSVLLSPLMTQEAVLSSRIEGTQATMGEVLEFEAEEHPANIPTEKRDDIEEILNYRKAMRHAETLLKSLPLCQRVVKEAHRVLLDGVRGHTWSPGEYRRIQNWIGSPGCSMEEARYIPISAGALPEAISEWERYIHQDAPDQLVQLALLHAEFEALHPFLDGNGRLGRMLVPLFMAKNGLLSEPMFYISAFFEQNRDEYYERLLAVSRDGNWTQWVAFFLKSVVEQARDNLSRATAILNLYESSKRLFQEITHSQYSIQALDFLFQRPLLGSADFVAQAGIPRPTARRILKVLRDNGILKVMRVAKGRRTGIYAYAELLNIAEGRPVL